MSTDSTIFGLTVSRLARYVPRPPKGNSGPRTDGGGPQAPRSRPQGGGGGASQVAGKGAVPLKSRVANVLPPWRHWLSLAFLAGGVAACAPLVQETPRPARLPPVKLAPDAVVLDAAFVRLPLKDQQSYDDIWQAADELFLPAELRRTLALNGLRVGRFGQQLPARLRELLDTPLRPLENPDEAASADATLGSTRQHLSIRSGQRTNLKTSEPYPHLSVLWTEDGQIRGHTLTEASCLLVLRAFPLGDGRVRCTLTPEIEHGPPRTRWVRGEGMLIQQTGQERLSYQRLEIEATLAAGEWLLVSTTPEVVGLGAAFFAQGTGPASHRRMLLVRLSQTQYDDLFAPEQTSAPLATPGE